MEMPNQLNLSANTSNITGLWSASVAYRATVSIVYVLLCLAGLVGYFLYCYVVIKHRKTLSNPFYAFTVSMAIPDCFGNFVTIVYAVPAVILSPTGSGPDLVPFWLSDIFGFICDYAWFLVCGHMVLIACNRLVSLKWRMQYNLLFSKKRMACLLLGCYLVALIIPAITYHCGCTFDFVQYAWTVICDSSEVRCSKVISVVDSAWTNAQIGFVLLCDAFILLYVYRKGLKIQPSITNHQQQQSSQQRQFKREKALILQFSAVAIILIVGQCIFWFLPSVIEQGHVTPEVAAFICMVLNILTSSLNPFLYFAFSSEVRRRLMNSKSPSGKTKPPVTLFLQNPNYQRTMAAQRTESGPV